MSEEIKEELELREKRYIYSLKENISFGDEDYKAHIILNYIQDLQQKVEQLESIRKEAIDYVYKHIQEYDADGTFTNLDEFDFIASPQVLLNILNKGDNK